MSLKALGKNAAVVETAGVEAEIAAIELSVMRLTTPQCPQNPIQVFQWV